MELAWKLDEFQLKKEPNFCQIDKTGKIDFELVNQVWIFDN